MTAKIRNVALKALVFFTIVVVITIRAIYVNQNKIISSLIHEHNTSGGIQVNFSKIKISPFKSFPYMSIILHDLELSKTKSDSIPSFLSYEKVYVGFDIFDLARGDYKVKKIFLENGKIDLEIYDEHNDNFLPQVNKEENSNSRISFDIQELEILNTRVIHNDFYRDHFYEILINSINASVSYNNAEINTHIDTDLVINKLLFNKTPYFKDKQIVLNSDFNYSVEKEFLQLKPSHISVEDGDFEIQGSVDLKNNNYLDIEMTGKESNFDIIIAFLADDVGQKLASYKNEGDVYFKGKVKGSAGGGEMPKIDFEFGCINAAFINPDKRKSVTDLNLKGYFTNGKDRSLESSELFIENFSGHPDKSVFRLAFGIRNFKAPQYFLDVDSKINLATIQHLYPVDDLEYSRGYALLNLKLNEFIDVDSLALKLEKVKEGYDNKIAFKEAVFKLKEYPYEIKIDGGVEVYDKEVEISGLKIKIKDNEMEVNGKVNNVLSLLAVRSGDLSGDLKFSSSHLNISEILNTSGKISDAEKPNVFSDLGFNIAFDTHNRFYVNKGSELPVGYFAIKNMYFRHSMFSIPVYGFNFEIKSDRNKVSVENLSGKVGESDFRVSAFVTNPNSLFSDTLQNIKVNATLMSQKINLRELLTINGESRMETTSIGESVNNTFVTFNIFTDNHKLTKFKTLPEMDINLIQATFKLENYNPLFSNIKGSFQIKNNAIDLKNFSGRIGSNQLDINGSLKNLSAFYSDSLKDYRISLSARAALLNLRELTTIKNSSIISPSFVADKLEDFQLDVSVKSHNKNRINEKYIPKTDIFLDKLSFKVKKLPDYEGSLKGYVHVEDDDLTSVLLGTMADNNFTINLTLNDYFELDEQDTKGKNKKVNFSFTSTKLDLDELKKFNPYESDNRAKSSVSEKEEAGYDWSQLPAVDLYINLKKLRYQKVSVDLLSGKIAGNGTTGLTFDRWKASLAGGKAEFKGRLYPKNMDSLRFESVLQVENLNLDDILYEFDNFGMESYKLNENLRGKLTTKVDSKFTTSNSFDIDKNSIDAKIEAKVLQGQLIRFAPIQAMAKYLGDKDLDNVKFSELTNTFLIKSGVVHIPKMVINSSLGYLLIDGFNTFNDEFDYQIQVPSKLVRKAVVNATLSKHKHSGNQKNGELSEEWNEEEIVLKPEEGSASYVFVTITGNADNYDFKLGKRKKSKFTTVDARAK